MAAGLIDRDRARVISNATLHLPDDLAAVADKVLAEAAPGMRLADLQHEGGPAGGPPGPRGRAGAQGRGAGGTGGWSCAGRTPARRRLAGRELDPAEALAGKASIDAEAVRLRNAGLPGTLAQIRAVILMDRIHQRSPWDRLAPAARTRTRPEADGDPGGDPGPDAETGPGLGPDMPAWPRRP